MMKTGKLNEKMRVGLIGCGKISEVYLECARSFANFEICDCADLRKDYAEQRAKEFDIQALTVDEILESDVIDIILNLTPPLAHADINMRAIKAGKHVYSEKPFAVEYGDAVAIMKMAEKSNRFAVSAPDSFLCAAQQKTRQLIDQRALGKIFGGIATVMFPVGYSSNHRDIGFFFKRGGGPLYDMGAYYLTFLVNTLGPVKRAAAVGSRLADTRSCTKGKNKGKVFPVEINTHMQVLLEFLNGESISLLCSFDVHSHSLPSVELYGEHGSIRLPELSMFGDTVEVFTRKTNKWEKIISEFKYVKVCRGIGLAELVKAISQNQEPRCSPAFVLHIQEIMNAIEMSAIKGRFIDLETKCQRPQMMNPDGI